MVSGVQGVNGTKIKTGTASGILKGIKSGHWKIPVEAVRNLTGDNKETVKEGLLAVMWSGEFSGRGKNGLVRHSGIVCIDLDHVADVRATVERLKGSPHVISAYRSPSGDGVKVLFDCRGHTGLTHPLAYSKAFEIAQSLAGHVPDDTSDVCRLCFVSYDPDLTFRWDTTPLPSPTAGEIMDLETEETEQASKQIEVRFTDETTPYGRTALEAECRRILEAPDGQRNNTIFKASACIGELVAGGEIAEPDAVKALEDSATTVGDNYSRDTMTVANGLNRGFSSPRKAPEGCSVDSDWHGMESDGATSDGSVVVQVTSDARPAKSKTGKEPVKLDRSAWGIVSGSDLKKTAPAPHQWVIEGWLPVGLTKLVSPEKAGKTFLAMQMAMSVAGKKQFLDMFGISKPGKVLYLGLEQSLGLNHERLLAMSGIDGIPDNLDIVSAGSDWPALDRGGLARLEAYIKEEKPSMIVIDVWQAVAPATNGRDNAYQADSKALRPLHGLANSTGTGILFIHHTRKGAVSSKDPSESTSGSRALDSVPDHNIFLSREHGSKDAIIKTKTRVARPIDDMALRFCPDSCLWTYMGSGDGHTLNIQRIQLLDILAEAKRPEDAMTALEIMDLLAEQGVERRLHAVRVQLHRMCEAGQIQKVGLGRRGESLRYYGGEKANAPSEDVVLAWDESDREEGLLR